jgi:hypothetical protein
MLRTDEAIAELRADLVLASKLYPGDDYRAVLGWIHEAFQPRTYLEIGVSSGDSFSQARADTLRVGVDPDPGIPPLSWSGACIESMTSDEFFKSGAAKKHFGDDELDFAFIDSLHLMEQVVEDFINVASIMTPGGVIAIHDILPIRAQVAEREKSTLMWTGDVWKAALLLRELWPDINHKIVKCIPSGLLLIHMDKPFLPIERADVNTALDRHLHREFDDEAKRGLSAFTVIENSKRSILTFATAARAARR